MNDWYISNDIPYKEEFPIVPTIDDAPSSTWKLADDIPFKGTFPTVPSIDDAPSSMWVSNDIDIPAKSSFPKVPLMGACLNCSNLEQVTFPSTLTSIGEYSFMGTKLTAVTLPAECTYYSTSFPPGCTITGGVLIG